MAEIVVPFSIAAVDVNLLDGTPVEIAAISGDSTLVRVPTRLEIWREAGTAYTITRENGGTAPLPFARTTQYIPEIYEARGIEPEITEFLTVRETVNDHPMRNIFRIPIQIVRVAGGNGVVCFPLLCYYHEPGDKTYDIASAVRLSGGTGVLSGRIYFSEFPTR